jgi:hypothetical protein
MASENSFEHEQRTVRHISYAHTKRTHDCANATWLFFLNANEASSLRSLYPRNPLHDQRSATTRFITKQAAQQRNP